MNIDILPPVPKKTDFFKKIGMSALLFWKMTSRYTSWLSEKPRKHRLAEKTKNSFLKMKIK